MPSEGDRVYRWEAAALGFFGKPLYEEHENERVEYLLEKEEFGDRIHSSIFLRWGGILSLFSFYWKLWCWFMVGTSFLLG